MKVLLTCWDALEPLRPLAQRDNWSRLGDRFSGSHTTLQTEDIIGAAVVIALFIGAIVCLRVLAAWQSRASQQVDPRHVFASLVASHRLSGRQKRIVRDVAAQAGLSDAAEVFVRPDLYSRVAAADPKLAERLYGGA